MRALMTFFFVLLSMFSTFLHSEEGPFSQTFDLQTPSVELTDGLPSNIVNNTVSVISGEYIDNAVDLVVQGPMPIVLSRTYSSYIKRGSLQHGWNHSLTKGVIAYKSKYQKKDVWALSMKEHLGSTFSFVHPLERKNDKVKSTPFNLVFPFGLTNGSDEMSGRTNIKNTRVFFNHEKKTILAISGGGIQTTYKHVDKKNKKYIYFAAKEKDLKNHTFQREDGKYTTLNSKTKLDYCKVRRKENKKFTKDPFLIYDCSDDRSVTYKFLKTQWKLKQDLMGTVTEDKINNFYLEEVVKSHAPSEKYEYSVKERDVHDYHIKKRSFPKGRFLSTEYYKKGTNHLEGPVGVIKIKDLTDYRVDRVKKQMTPVGHDETPIVTQRFVYDAKFKTRSSGAVELESGITDVYNAYWHKMSYEYNSEHRLQRIKKFVGNPESGYSCYSFEGFDWAEKDTPMQGTLLSRYVVDAKTWYVQAGYHYGYDHGGNLLSKSFFGKLTGTHSPTIILDRFKIVETGYERDTTSYTYSQEGFNLVKSETDSNGNTYYYNYYEGTDLLKEKLLVCENKIQQREFYTYNDDSVLTKKIIDDGCSAAQNDFSGVTEQHITAYYPQKVIPIGLYERIDEMYLDLNTMQEVLLKRTLCKFNKQGLLLGQETYDANGNFGNACSFEYNAHGKVIKETNALGEVVVKDYDDNDNLTRQENLHADYKIINSYDCSNRLVTQEEIHINGPHYKITNRYNYLGQKIASTNTFGGETSYTYNELGQLIETRLAPVADENNRVVNPVIRSEYDVCGFLTCTTDAKGRRTVIENNARGQPLSISFPDGSQERYIYRLDGKLLQKTNRDGTKTVYTLDSKGRITAENIYGEDGQCIKGIHRTYSPFHLISETDFDGLTIRYSYDGAGRLHQTFKNDQLVKRTHYDSLGRVSSEEDWYDAHHYRITTKAYDALDRVIEQKVFSSDQTIHQIESCSYDCHGNKAVIREGDRVTKTTFNSQNKPCEMIDAEGNTTRIVYDTAFLNEHRHYVLQTKTTDAIGNQTVATYDTANRIVQTIRKNAFGVTLSNQRIRYDLCGNATQVIDEVIHNEKVLKTILTNYGYTSDNQMEWVIEAAGTPEQKTTFYQYNRKGQKCVKIKPDGIHLIYDYDVLGRLKVLSASDGSLNYHYEYNQRDQITRITDKLTGETTHRHYNHFGQMIREKLGNGLTLDYRYDLFERLLVMTLPDQSGIEYNYDGMDLKAVHRMKKGNCAYTYTVEERDLAGKVTKASLPGQVGQVLTRYDKLNRCISLKTHHFNQTVPQGGYSPVGNLLNYTTNTQNYSFTYDDLDQIKSEDGHVSHNYENDSLSNRLKKDGVDHVYNSLNQLTVRGKDHYEYDANGNLVRKIVGESITVYTYDALDRLTKVNVNGEETSYRYDPFHRRLSKTQEGNPPIYFLYQGNEEIGAWKDGVLTELKILTDDQRKSVAVEVSESVYFPTQDLFGNVVNLIDLQGQLVESYRYSAFGEAEIIGSDGHVKEVPLTPWGYSNKRFDRESGLVAYGLRYYDPDLGRWLCPDPAGYEDGPNLYAHVHNNPLKYYDLLGLFGESISLNSVFSFFGDFAKSAGGFVKSIFCCPDAVHTSGTYDLNYIADPSGTSYDYPSSNDFWIGFGNGICNAKKDFVNSMLHLGEMFKHNILGTFDCSRGFFSDGVNYILGRLGMQTQGVREKLAVYRHFLATADPKALFLDVCHSKGLVNAAGALARLTPEERKRIAIIGVAPGCYIDPDHCHSAIYLTSDRDIVPWLDPIGRFKNRDSIVHLKAHENASRFMDHSFTSPTYTEPLQYAMRKFVKTGAF